MTKEEILKRAQDSRYNQLDEMEIDIIQKVLWYKIVVTARPNKI